MNLNYEIRQLLASFNTPPAIVEQMAVMIADLERNRVAPGIETGQIAPDFTLPTEEGELVRLSERLSRGPVVLTFFRGAWCAVCNLQVAALIRAMPEIQAAGGTLLGIHPDRVTMSSSRLPAGFLLLSDADQEVIRRYRMQFTMPAEIQRIYLGTFDIDISARNRDGSWNLPVPGTFVLDQSGRVRRRHVTADFTHRMEPDDVVAALEEIRGGLVVH